MRNRLSLIQAMVVMAFAASSFVAFGAKGGSVLLSTGLVFPSNNYGSFASPGRLVQSMKGIEVLAEPVGTPLTLDGSFAGSSKSVGYGVGFNYAGSSSKAAYGGLAFGGSSFGVGVTPSYNLDTSTFALNAGIAIGGATGFGLAFVARNVTDGFNNFGGGIGYRATKIFRLEANVNYVNVPGVGIIPSVSATTLDPAIGLDLANGKFSLIAGYAFPISPSMDFGAGTFRAGAGFWVSNAFGLQYAYNGVLGTHTMGLNIAL